MEYIKILMNLISIDTSVPPGRNYPVVIEYLEPLFKEAGCQTEKVWIPKECTKGLKGERVNLLAHRREPGKQRLIFYTHVDVIPAKGWLGFEPRQKNGTVYGRGAADMKGSIVALLLALEKVKGKLLRYDVSVMVTTDEEMVGQQRPQLEYLAQYLGSLEGSYIWDLDCGADYVTIADLGSIQMEIEIAGKAVHSALSRFGVNAIEQAVSLQEDFLRLKKKVIQRKSEIPVSPETGLKKMEGGLNLNVIKGGVKANVVADKCTISLDRRLIPEEKLESAQRELHQVLLRAKQKSEIEAKVKKIRKSPSCIISADDPVVEKAARILQKVTGQSGKYGTMGSTDLAGIISTWKAKKFGLGVFRPESNIHGANEFVRLQDVKNLAKIIGKFLTGD